MIRLFLCLLCVLAPASVALRAAPLPYTSVPLYDLSAFAAPGDNWRIAGGIGGDPRTQPSLEPESGVGIVVNTSAAENGTHLFTRDAYGDLDLEMDFLMPVGSNSGVYLQGRYEIQLFDSWGVEQPKFSDVGGIYQRWIEAESRGFEGHAPPVNAARAPGLWQHLRISFRAPRFDEAGRKIANAKFVEVALNGYVLHRDIEVTGPTRAAFFEDEQPLGPLMIQGDHGPVAIRNLRIKPFEPGAVSITGLSYEIWDGRFEKMDTYRGSPPDETGHPEAIDPAAHKRGAEFAAVYSGNLTVPRAGVYGFAVDTNLSARLTINDEVVLAPMDSGAVPGSVDLPAGTHPFRLDLLHLRPWADPKLKLLVEGPRMEMRELTPPSDDSADKGEKLIIKPEDGRVRVQRGFVAFPPIKRLYAISVGYPGAVHYAYDFERGAILRGWSGDFLDMFQMWDGRGYNQLALAGGPAIDFGGDPAFALLPWPEADWPDAPDPLYSSDGYNLEPDGQPVFLSRLSGLRIRDRVSARVEPRGLERVVEIEGSGTSWLTAVLLAAGSRIEPQPDGRGYIIGDREYYLDLPPDSDLRPSVRTRPDREELVILLPGNAGARTIRYTLVW